MYKVPMNRKTSKLTRSHSLKNQEKMTRILVEASHLLPLITSTKPLQNFPQIRLMITTIFKQRQIKQKILDRKVKRLMQINCKTITKRLSNLWTIKDNRKETPFHRYFIQISVSTMDIFLLLEQEWPIKNSKVYKFKRVSKKQVA